MYVLIGVTEEGDDNTEVYHNIGYHGDKEFLDKIATTLNNEQHHDYMNYLRSDMLKSDVRRHMRELREIKTYAEIFEPINYEKELNRMVALKFAESIIMPVRAKADAQRINRDRNREKYIQMLKEAEALAVEYEKEHIKALPDSERAIYEYVRKYPNKTFERFEVEEIKPIHENMDIFKFIQYDWNT